MDASNYNLFSVPLIIRCSSTNILYHYKFTRFPNGFLSIAFAIRSSYSFYVILYIYIFYKIPVLAAAPDMLMLTCFPFLFLQHSIFLSVHIQYFQKSSLCITSHVTIYTSRCNIYSPYVSSFLHLSVWFCFSTKRITIFLYPLFHFLFIFHTCPRCSSRHTASHMLYLLYTYITPCVSYILYISRLYEFSNTFHNLLLVTYLYIPGQ